MLCQAEQSHFCFIHPVPSSQLFLSRASPPTPTHPNLTSAPKARDILETSVRHAIRNAFVSGPLKFIPILISSARKATPCNHAKKTLCTKPIINRSLKHLCTALPLKRPQKNTTNKCYMCSIQLAVTNHIKRPDKKRAAG